MKFSLTVLAASLVAFVQASNVVELNPNNFDSVIAGKLALVEFFAPWCGHCKNLAPTYELLADAFAHAKDKVVIAKVDADGEGKPLGAKYGVQGFPTLKWFDPSGADTPYEGGRELEDLVTFVSTQSGIKSNIKPPPPPVTQILDIQTFDDVALNQSKDVIVAFTAPWCGHCKQLKPVYEEVAKDFIAEKNCIVANVDADAAQNKPLAEKYEVTSYPTIKFFGKNSKAEPELYDGPRTRQGFIEFLNKRCETHRSVGGGLDEYAGRVLNMDSLAAKFTEATGEARAVILKEVAAAGEDAKHYLRVMQKVIGGSEAYVEKEYKRLTSIIEKRTLLPEKLDEIQIKLNILSSFQKKEEESARRTTDEL